LAKRADALLAAAPGEQGANGALLIIDGETGEDALRIERGKYFGRASNMKLFSTALALAKLGRIIGSYDLGNTRHVVPAGV